MPALGIVKLLNRDKMMIDFCPIGIIHSPFTEIEDMPIQPSGASGISGTIEIDHEYIAGLKDIDSFSHIILIYHFHKAKSSGLVVTPFLDSQKRGIFSTRAPVRPNPIGLSIVKLINVTQNMLIVENIDVIDGTPLLDIKPYVPEFDKQTSVRIGWLEGKGGKIQNRKSDSRFI